MPTARETLSRIALSSCHGSGLARNYTEEMGPPRPFSASTSGVVAGVLVEERQRLERPHAVEKEDAVKVIRLVLRDARVEILERQIEPAAVAVETAQANF